jgi:hypothetical protein
MRLPEVERLRALPPTDQEVVMVQLRSVAAPSASGRDQNSSGKQSDAGHFALGAPAR